MKISSVIATMILIGNLAFPIGAPRAEKIDNPNANWLSIFAHAALQDFERVRRWEDALGWVNRHASVLAHFLKICTLPDERETRKAEEIMRRATNGIYLLSRHQIEIAPEDEPLILLLEEVLHQMVNLKGISPPAHSTRLSPEKCTALAVLFSLG